MTEMSTPKTLPARGEAQPVPQAEAPEAPATPWPHSSLADLGVPPLLRGSVDTFEDGVLEGWALSAEDPLRPVRLEVWLAGVRVARLTTGEQRGDVAKIVGLPVRAGYVVDLPATVTEAGARNVLAALRALKSPSAALEDVLSVRIEGTELTLPMSARAHATKVDIARLAKRLSAAKGLAFGNDRIALVRSLLDGHLVPEAEDGDVRVIAYYLPQFHPFAENDEWWGNGFTEWTNVTTAKPYFKDHYQPHLPADMGFYDLRLDQVQRDQIELAKRYGVTGFCYYYYWFSGKTLMTLPIDRHVEQDLDMDFCLCWANESWSRRWDGSESDLLIGQRHSYDSDVEFIHACLPYFRSKRYIKLDGAPLLQVYRISLMERPRETIERWRQIVRAQGFPDLHVSMVESFGLTDPFEYGCDSSCQFPPHGVVGDRINPEIEELAPKFTGVIYSYAEIVRGEIARPNPPHTRFRAAMPSWDNTARKGPAGNVFAGATPALFETWMRFLADDARRRLPEGQRLVFVNAWNEWAEGTHLEPDRKYGHANLRAVRNALAPEARAVAPLLPPSDGTEDRLADTRRYVASLITANRELARLVSQTKFGMRVVEENHFVPISSTLLNVKPAGPARFHFETLNGRSIDRDTTVCLSVSQGLALKGWAVLSEEPAASLFASLRSTTPTRGSQRYIASIHYREPRTDVVEALGLDGSLLHNGFVLRASLLGILPGEYAIELIFPDSVSATSGRVVQTGLFVLIG